MEVLLPILDQRGLSGLWSIDRTRGGITFNCFSVITSMPVGGFECYGAGTEKGLVSPVDDQCDEWSVFVPFGTTAFLHWLNQYDVVILSTPHGPLEVMVEWVGGGPSNYQAWAVMPDGTTYEGTEVIPQAVAAHWELAIEKLTYIGKYVKYRDDEGNKY